MSLGFGLWVGFPTAYPYYYGYDVGINTAPYGYSDPYGYPESYPASLSTDQLPWISPNVGISGYPFGVADNRSASAVPADVPA